MRKIVMSKGVDLEQSVMRKETIVGNNCEIAPTVVFKGEYSYPIEIGDNVKIDNYTIIERGVKIGNGAKVNSCVRIESGSSIGDNTFIGHSCVLRPFTSIGSNCVVGHLTVFEGRSVVGDGTLIHAQNHITRGVKIGNKVFIAPMFCGANDPVMIHARRNGKSFEPVPYVIEDYVRIGIGVNLLPGVRIKKNAVIGAGSLVTRDVEENWIVYGTPAIYKGEVSEEERL